jgi:antitoxin MazE
MQTAVRKLGNSAGVVIPKTIFAELGLSAGDALDMRLEEGRLARDVRGVGRCDVGVE